MKFLYKNIQSNLIPIVFYLLCLIDCNRCDEEKEECELLQTPENGYVLGGICTREVGNVCAFNCKIGYNLVGSRIRICSMLNNSTLNNTHNTTTTTKTYWIGTPTNCEPKKCPILIPNVNNLIQCSKNKSEFGTNCTQKCSSGFKLIGSLYRLCTAIGSWSGIPGRCVASNDSTTGENDLDINSNNMTFDQTTFDPMNYSIVMGGFNKNVISVEFDSLPVTLTLWIKPISTQNLNIFDFFHGRQKLSLTTDFYSRFCFLKNDRLFQNSDSPLPEKQWTHLTVVITAKDISFYVNGALDIFFNNNFLINTRNNSREKHLNRVIPTEIFKIKLNMKPRFRAKTKISETEITRFFVLKYKLSDKDAVELYYNCDTVLLKTENSAFNWSRINVTDIEAKYFRLSGFCSNCRQPTELTNAMFNYTGLSTGDSIIYECPSNMVLRGYSTSVCLLYGKWSNEPPFCEYF